MNSCHLIGLHEASHAHGLVQDSWLGLRESSVLNRQLALAVSSLNLLRPAGATNGYFAEAPKRALVPVPPPLPPASGACSVIPAHDVESNLHVTCICHFQRDVMGPCLEVWHVLLCRTWPEWCPQSLGEAAPDGCRAVGQKLLSPIYGAVLSRLDVSFAMI